MKRRTSATCCSRSMMSHVYSNMRKRGSKPTAPLAASSAWWRLEDIISDSETALSSMPLPSATVASSLMEPLPLMASPSSSSRSIVSPMQRMLCPTRITVMKLAAARLSAEVASSSDRKGLTVCMSFTPFVEMRAAARALSVRRGVALALCPRLRVIPFSSCGPSPLPRLRALVSSTLPASSSTLLKACRSSSSSWSTVMALLAAAGFSAAACASVSDFRHLRRYGVAVLRRSVSYSTSALRRSIMEIARLLVAYADSARGKSPSKSRSVMDPSGVACSRYLLRLRDAMGMLARADTASASIDRAWPTLKGQISLMAHDTLS
mmetsp:Transcript_7845/g.22342  ORF Transcript_7845/g.22342 Transcript_7845/m.22342 type:complete len:322 (-) Transcript_7845:7509-8474(-)